MTGLWIVLGVLAAVIVLVLLFVWSIYNSLVRLNERVNEAWSDITVQLKYRADLIPNLVETVKGYAAHESEVFQNVSAARAGLLSAGDNVKAAAEAAIAPFALDEVAFSVLFLFFVGAFGADGEGFAFEIHADVFLLKSGQVGFQRMLCQHRLQPQPAQQQQPDFQLGTTHRPLSKGRHQRPFFLT